MHELAGKPAPYDQLINVPRLMSAYYNNKPDYKNTNQRISFGTSGHRGSSTNNTFNENHVISICQALCEYRKSKKISGPLFIGKDTHALSEAAFSTAIEVFAANEVEVRIQSGFGYTPTPVISHAILTFNKDRKSALADGVVITPSHNPPNDGGFKYNPPNGGPADTNTTRLIQDRANEILKEGADKVKRIFYEKALQAKVTRLYDYITPYVVDLLNIIDMELISASALKIGADPMGGSGVAYWQPIAETYKLDIDVVNKYVDPTFSFMTVDKDGKIRMDCSSPYAMASLIDLKEEYDISFGNDPDFDRHGIVSRGGGLMNPNHYLAVAVWYLFQNRSQWRDDAAVGKTLVSSSLIDRIAKHLDRKLREVPVGFKWFVDGLIDGSYGFGGEESAGASFLRKDGSVWTTDKDGIIMDLLAAEIMAKTGKDPAELYKDLEEQFGSPIYERMDAPADKKQKDILKNLTAKKVEALELAGEKVVSKLTHAPGNNAAIGGLKVVTENGWFAARPSGTENIYKIYAESFKGSEHLNRIKAEAQDIVNKAFAESGP
jgi:phosphoglucomutase